MFPQTLLLNYKHIEDLLKVVITEKHLSEELICAQSNDMIAHLAYTSAALVTGVN